MTGSPCSVRWLTPVPTRSRSGCRSLTRWWTGQRSRRRRCRPSSAARRPSRYWTTFAPSKGPVPLVVMTYCNLVLRAGTKRFAAQLAGAGVRGAILPDLPLEESGEWEADAAAEGVETVLLAAPVTPDDRLALICEHSHGFIYGVNLMGVTRASATACPLVRRCSPSG